MRFFATHAAIVASTNDITIPEGSTVMFQRIIHDGLVGHKFLSAYDLARSTMIFSRRATPR